MPTVFDDMDELHIQKVWNELSDRFGFPEREWKRKFKGYLDKQPREVSTTSAFLRFGTANINPILNKLLLRGDGIETFSRLVVFVITESESFKKKHAERKKMSSRR